MYIIISIYMVLLPLKYCWVINWFRITIILGNFDIFPLITQSDIVCINKLTLMQYYDVQTLEYRYISKLPMKKERIWSNVKETTSHLQRGRRKVFNKVGLFNANTVSSVYMRITTFPNFFTRGYRSHQMLLIQN